MQEKVRIDKWLWAARFYKTRTLAADAVNGGKILVNDMPVKPARELKVGDVIRLRREGFEQTVDVLRLSDMRGPASTAQQLYSETEQSLQAKGQWSEQRRLAREPSLSIEHGRPTKRNRRKIDENLGRTWNTRWSASID